MLTQLTITHVAKVRMVSKEKFYLVDSEGNRNYEEEKYCPTLNSLNLMSLGCG